jgi:uncharacterized protein YjiS (DUF1127 family)
MRSEFGDARRAGAPTLPRLTLVRLGPRGHSSELVPTRHHVGLREALAFARRRLRARLVRRMFDRGALSAASIIGVWVARSRSRRELRDLNERALLDIGLTRCDVWRESSKPFWKG